MKNHIVVFSMVLFLALSSCMHSNCNLSGVEARRMMSQTVKVNVEVKGILVQKKNETEISKTPHEISWIGTGVVVAVDKTKNGGESIILSAAHVVNVPKLFVQQGEDGLPIVMIVESFEETVEKNDGTICKASVLIQDEDTDVGALKAECIAGDVAPLAQSLPQPGDSVSVVGAGLGVHPRNSFLVTEGRYVGPESDITTDVVITAPVAKGNSGSGVFADGKVIGIVSKKSSSYEHITFVAPLPYLKETLKRAMEKW